MLPCWKDKENQKKRNQNSHGLRFLETVRIETRNVLLELS
jgi:hypothetical protein